MKMRIRGNSLRLRVTRSELERLVDTGAIEERMQFAPDRQLVYRLRIDDRIESITAGMDDAVITVSLPEEIARRWATTEKVSLRCEQRIDDGSTLGILVEKDFACLVEREGEDDSDAFPHPEGDSC